MSAFSTDLCPSCSVILLFFVDAAILSRRRSDAWSVVPKILSRYIGNHQSSGSMAVHNSMLNVLASSYTISWLSSFRAFERMLSSLGDMSASHLLVWSNAPVYFLLADLTPVLICYKEWGQVWKSPQCLQQ